MNRAIKWSVTILAIFAVGVTLGAIFSARTNPALLYDYFERLSGSEISIGAMEAVLSALVTWSILFFSAFFKFGSITTSLTVVVGGFVDGYSITSILRILGTRGLPMCFFDILNVPVMLLLAANTMHCLTTVDRAGKAFVIRSVILLAALLLAELLSAWLSVKVLLAVLAKFEF